MTIFSTPLFRCKHKYTFRITRLLHTWCHQYLIIPPLPPSFDITLIFCFLSCFCLFVCFLLLSFFISLPINKFRINYIEEISIKSDTKKMNDDQISKIIIALYYCKLSTDSLAMIIQSYK